MKRRRVDVFVQFTFLLLILKYSVQMGASESMPTNESVPEIMDSRKQMKKSFQFNTRMQGENEDFNNFFNNVSQLAKDCGYGDLTDRMLRDKIISGVFDGNLRNHLLGTDNLTLEQAREVAAKWPKNKREGEWFLLL